MLIDLIRHAESEMNLNRARIGGRASWCELTDRGRAQARALGTHLLSQGIHHDAVFCSTAVRAQQTTRLMLEAMGVSPWNAHTRQDLEEVFYGAWEGAPRDEVYTPAMLERAEADPWTFRPPGGGETIEEGSARLMEVLREAAQMGLERVAVVSHGLLIRGAIVRIEGLETRTAYHVEVRNTSVTTLEVTASGDFKMRTRADAAHLDASGLGSLSGVLRPATTTAQESRPEEA